MAVTLIKLGTLTNIPAGTTATSVWHNAAPSKAVWTIQAVPMNKSLVAPFDSQKDVEVTRVWRVAALKTAQPPNPVTDADVKHEIHYEVKNVGVGTVSVDIYASVVS